MLLECQQLTVSIARAAGETYAFVRDPSQLPDWAAGLSGSIEEVAGEWWAESPMGRVKVEFAPDNPFGVVDHTVTLPDGTAVLNPMRVLANADGCEVTFTLFRRQHVSAQEFAADARLVRGDLDRLKALLEK